MHIPQRQARKWLITINNPKEKDLSHERIYEILQQLKSTMYMCMADEIGKNGTYHTHVYICLKNGVRFSRLKNLIEEAHFDVARGTSIENRDYVSKQGKWADDKKAETSVENTFREWGELPKEYQGKRNDITYLYELIQDGLSDYEIMQENPQYLLRLDKIGRARQTFIEEQYKDSFRNIYVTYLYGSTGTGKTRSVLEKFGYSNVFRITDYKHPFDNYNGQEAIIFEEFRSSLPIQDMLTYLEGYPLELPCRYFNKFACYSTVYIITNIPLSQQYTNIQEDSPKTYEAFKRRINKIVYFTNETYEHANIILSNNEQQSIEGLIDITYAKGINNFD